MQKPKWEIGEWNEGNARNAEKKGGNMRNRKGIRVWGTSMEMQEIWVAMQRIKAET